MTKIAIPILLVFSLSGCGPKVIKAHVVPTYTGIEGTRGPFGKCIHKHSSEILWIDLSDNNVRPFVNSIGITPNYTENNSLVINIKIGSKDATIKKQTIRLTDLDGNIIKNITVPYSQISKRNYKITLQIGSIPIKGAKLQLPTINLNDVNNKKVWRPSGVIILKRVSSSVQICA